MAVNVTKAHLSVAVLIFIFIQIFQILYYTSVSGNEQMMENSDLGEMVRTLASENLSVKQQLYELEECVKAQVTESSNSTQVHVGRSEDCRHLVRHRRLAAGQPPHVVYVDTMPLKGFVPSLIKNWMQASGAKCVEGWNKKQCPCVPPGLKGKMLINQNLTMAYTWKQVLDVVQTGDLKKGGKWKPLHCNARRRLLIIIPYRDREQHLKAFLAHMHPILQRQLLEYRIMVVEQNSPVIFNKAAMINIGYKEAEKRGLGPFDCVMFHDVDVLMEDDRNLIICGRQPVHYGVFLDRHNYKKCCQTYLGAAASFTWKQYATVNGFSNKFFGWGGEDDNMYYRLKRKRLFKAIPLVNIGTYTILKHTRDSENSPNSGNTRLAYKIDYREGLSTLKYSIVEYEELDLYTWILADLAGLPYPSISSSMMFSRISGQCPSSPTIYNMAATTIDQCEVSCALNASCSAFVSQNLAPENFTCDMKSGGCEESSMSHLLSGLNTHLKGVDINLKSGNVQYTAYTVDCKGNDVTIQDAQSTQECAIYCNKEINCMAFVFQARPKKCYLKSACTPPKYRLGAVQVKSYVKKYK